MYKNDDEKVKELKKVASQVRRDIIRMVSNAGSGHPGGALGCTELFVSLYFEIMKHDASFNMDAKNEDLFFLSNGHISAGWYATLARAGYFDPKELSTHRKIDSRLQGHPATEEGLEGIRMASGSLGQGLSVATGAAQTKKLNNDPQSVFVLMGDGELQEGQVWEAAMYAAHNKIDNIVAVVDYNGQQIDGPVKEIMSLLDLKAKWHSFGWHVIDVQEGNDMSSMLNALTEAREFSGKPVVILMQSEMGYGVDFMVGTHKWHGVAPNAEQTEKALSQLEETIGDF